MRRSSRRLLTGGLVAAALLGALNAAALASAGPRARTATTTSLNERAQLHKTGYHELTLNEQGTATGTIKGAIYIHLNVESKRVTAEVNIYPSGGSLTGYASASYHTGTTNASFSGTMSITRGSGRYAHARATGLHFTGSIRRIDDYTTVEVSGKLSE
jgi:hypothetical protein